MSGLALVPCRTQSLTAQRFKCRFNIWILLQDFHVASRYWSFKCRWRIIAMRPHLQFLRTQDKALGLMLFIIYTPFAHNWKTSKQPLMGFACWVNKFHCQCKFHSIMCSSVLHNCALYSSGPRAQSAWPGFAHFSYRHGICQIFYTSI